MSDLVEFLLARVAEDEAVGRDWRAQRSMGRDKVSLYGGGNGYERILDPARVLAECEAKRRIVALHQDWPVLIQTEPTIEHAPDGIEGLMFRATQQIAWATNREYVARFGTEPPTTPVLRALALPYADHPDYREEWRL